MTVSYESRSVGAVRAMEVTGYAGIGMSQLRFSLEWSLNPRRDETFTVFGTSAWVSAMPEGEPNALMLGHAAPEIAWSDDCKEGYQVARPVPYRLTLPSPQLLALEQLRHGRELVFLLDVQGHVDGPRGVRSFESAVSVRVNVSDWVRVLKQAGAAEILLVGVNLPVRGAKADFHSAIELVRKAHEHLILGQYTVAVAECRRAIETLWKVANLTEDARAARKRLATRPEQEAMTLLDRELALGEAVRNYCHVAHHDSEPEIFGRTHAALVVGTTAGLVSSIIAAPDLPRLARVERQATLPVVATKSSSAGAEGQEKPNALSLSEQVAKVRDHLHSNAANRPRTMKSLRSAVHSLFAKKLEEQQLEGLMKELKKRKVVVEVDGKPTYPNLGK